MPVHVVHLIARLNDGGPARAIAALVAGLQARHRLTVLTGTVGPGERDLSALVAASGATVVVVPQLGRRLSLTGDWLALRAVRRELRRLQPDLLHTHTAKAGAIGRLLARGLGIPCLHTYHGHVLHGYFPRLSSALAASAERLLAGTAWHQALTMSQYHELHQSARIGRQARWRVLPLPIPVVTPCSAPWQAQLRPAVPVLGFLGRLTAVKDGELWLRVLALLQGRMAVQGVVCGDGEERARLEQQARALGLPVLFTGFVPAGEALAVFGVLLMTSRNEGLPFAAIEAAGAGVPVVAPPVGGLVELIRWRAVRGARRTPEALATACAALLTQPGLRRRQLAEGRRCALALAPEPIAARIEALYAAMLATAGPQPVGAVA